MGTWWEPGSPRVCSSYRPGISCPVSFSKGQYLHPSLTNLSLKVSGVLGFTPDLLPTQEVHPGRGVGYPKSNVLNPRRSPPRLFPGDSVQDLHRVRFPPGSPSTSSSPLLRHVYYSLPGVPLPGHSSLDQSLVRRSLRDPFPKTPVPSSRGSKGSGDWLVVRVHEGSVRPSPGSSPVDLR